LRAFFFSFFALAGASAGVEAGTSSFLALRPRFFLGSSATASASVVLLLRLFAPLTAVKAPFLTGLEVGRGGDEAGGAAFLRPPFRADLGVLTGGGVGSFSSSSEVLSSDSSSDSAAAAAAAGSSASTSSSSASTSGLSAATGAPLALKSASSLV
jgi:hypothetical protein